MNKNKGLNILTLSLALSGIISTTSGLILNKCTTKKHKSRSKGNRKASCKN